MPANNLDATQNWQKVSAPVRIVISVVVFCHIAAILCNVFAVESGPWPAPGTPKGQVFSPPPVALRGSLVESAKRYLSLLRLDENSRFPSLRPTMVHVQFEAVAFDEHGKEIGRHAFPDPNAWPWTRSRQTILAYALATDLARLPPEGEKIYPAGQEPNSFMVWRPNAADKNLLELQRVQENLLSREEQARDTGPSEWGLALSQSYARFFCRALNANTVEIRRSWNFQTMPSALLDESAPPAESFSKHQSNYGKVSDVNRQ